MNTPPRTKILVEQGAVVVGAGFYVEAKGDDVVALFGDLRTKYAIPGGYAGGSGTDTPPGICLDTTCDSLNTHPTETGLTLIRFPEYMGWNVHCMDVAKYTVTVCLTRIK